METIFFRNHRKNSDDGYNIYRLLSDLKGKKDVRIVFDKDTYEISPDYCFERAIHISNHGWNGYKRIIALLEEMESVELDFSGSIILTHDVITPFAIINSKNITIKNVTLENTNICFMQTRVLSHGDGYIELEKMQGADSFFMRHGRELAMTYDESMFIVVNNIEVNPTTGTLEPGTSDHTMKEFLWNMRFEDIGNGKLRLHGIKRYPPVGNILIFSVERRLGCGFFCEDSENVRLENVTVHSCHGMGILAQTCHNITLDGFNTLRHGDQYYTANADATHFVNCTGLVKVENCTFEGQLDDALNIHGMYIRIEKIGEGEIFVREVHSQAKGIRVIRAGDKVQILHPKTLIPYTEKTVKEAEYINKDSIRIVFEEGNDGIRSTGDVLESLNRVADLIFRNNVVRHNRARGMLIATKGDVLIENNYFNTSGCAILFQSDGVFWFESGGVYNVHIKGNVFDACRYSPWGNAIIDCPPRPEEEENKYFHKKIAVTDNRFIMINDSVALFNNAEEIVFEGNTVECDETFSPYITVQHVAKAKIETDLPIQH